MSKNEALFLELVKAGIFKLTKQGEIFRVKKGHKEWNGEFRDCKPKLLNHKNYKGYVRLTIRIDKIRIHIFGHRMIWMFFKGDIPEELQINHKNGIKDDNRLSNLELMSNSEQMLHAVNILERKVGNKTKGRNRKGINAKLKKEEIIIIRKLLNKGKSCTKIAEIFNVTYQSIRNIARGVT